MKSTDSQPLGLRADPWAARSVMSATYCHVKSISRVSLILDNALVNAFRKAAAIFLRLRGLDLGMVQLDPEANHKISRNPDFALIKRPFCALR